MGRLVPNCEYERAGHESKNEFNKKATINMTGRKILLVVDVQRDFIDGSLAVPGAEAIIPEINGIKNGADLVYFTLDWHPKDHCSFKANGGQWPEHCVHYTLGASLADGLLDGLEEAKTRFILKGQNKEREEYRALAAVTASNQSLFLAGDEVTVCGIASEFCVLETLKNVFRLSQEVGFNVNVFLKGTVGFDSTPLLEWMAGNGVKEY